MISHPARFLISRAKGSSYKVHPMLRNPRSSGSHAYLLFGQPQDVIQRYDPEQYPRVIGDGQRIPAVVAKDIDHRLLRVVDVQARNWWSMICATVVEGSTTKKSLILISSIKTPLSSMTNSQFNVSVACPRLADIRQYILAGLRHFDRYIIGRHQSAYRPFFIPSNSRVSARRSGVSVFSSSLT
jgi:hypothetical protein